MLNIRVISIGKDKEPWITDGCNHYLKLLSRYARVELLLLPSLKSASSLSGADIKATEAEKLGKAVGTDYLVALHDRGQTFDSPALARRLQKIETDARGTVSFVIGGAFGLDERLLERADLILSLSPLTFSHQLTRLILLEQLFRAYSILHGTAYHK